MVQKWRRLAWSPSNGRRNVGPKGVPVLQSWFDKGRLTWLLKCWDGVQMTKVNGQSVVDYDRLWYIKIGLTLHPPSIPAIESKQASPTGSSWLVESWRSWLGGFGWFGPSSRNIKTRKSVNWEWHINPDVAGKWTKNNEAISQYTPNRDRNWFREPPSSAIKYIAMNPSERRNSHTMTQI